MPDQQHVQAKRAILHRRDGRTQEFLDTLDTVLAEEASGNTTATQTVTLYETTDGRTVHGLPAQTIIRCRRCKQQFSETASIPCSSCQRYYCRRHLNLQDPLCRVCRFRRWWHRLWRLP